MLGKRGFEFSFAWIFAVIVGAFILVLAIYAVAQIIETEKYNLNTQTAAQLSIIFEPMETGLAEARLKILEFNQETKIFNECYNENDFGSSGSEFGENKISLAIKTGIGKWQEPGGNITIKNKYLFSDKTETGEKLMLLSKALYMPFKVSDLIIFSARALCWEKSSLPDIIKDEFPSLAENPEGPCTSEMPLVCFGFSQRYESKCDIVVVGCQQSRGDSFCKYDYYYGYVINRGTSAKKDYVGGLLYAAIYSDPDIYECNVKRIAKRLEKQAKVFIDESTFLYGTCGAVNPGEGAGNTASFRDLSIIAREIQRSGSVILTDTPPSNPKTLLNIIESLDTQNDAAECNLW